MLIAEEDADHCKKLYTTTEEGHRSDEKFWFSCLIVVFSNTGFKCHSNYLVPYMYTYNDMYKVRVVNEEKTG